MDENPYRSPENAGTPPTIGERVHKLPASINGLGTAGFIVSLLALFTCGIASPIGVLLSLPALFKPPRAFAIAGTVLGLIGTAFLLWAIVPGLLPRVLRLIFGTHFPSGQLWPAVAILLR